MNENNMRKRVFQIIILTLFVIPLLISGNYLYHSKGILVKDADIETTSTTEQESDSVDQSKETGNENSVSETVNSTNEESSNEESSNEEPVTLIVAEHEYLPPYANKQIKMMEDTNTTLYFGSQSFKIVEEDLSVLDDFIKIAVQFPDETINIEGHANGYPNFENSILEQSLSQDRINSVSDYMVSRGVSEDRIAVYNCGSGQPLSLEEENQALNDRVEIYFESYNAKGAEAK